MNRVGVIGAGQLARMMQVPAISLGIGLGVFAENENSSASLSATRVGDYNDFDELREFAKTVDVITFDHEHVPTQLLKKLEQLGHKVRPGSHALIHAQNKLVMRAKLAELGIDQPVWAAAASREAVEDFLKANGPEIVVKTPIGGYDGKGVRVISEVSQVEDWIVNIGEFGGQLLCEEKVQFVRELAQLSARSASGEFAAWPTVETRQRGGVCAEVIAPAARVEHASMQQLAKQISTGLEVIGVMAVELFEDSNGRVLVNELAMRPHNSGHFSIEGSHTSQFEQHLRAVLDLPLGDTGMTSDCAVMANLLGVDESNDFVSHYPAAMKAFPHLKFHVYGKDAREGRKMGHLTLLGSDPDFCLSQLEGARSILYGEDA